MILLAVMCLAGCGDARAPAGGVAQVAALRVRVEHWADVAMKASATSIQLARSVKDNARIQAAERHLQEIQAAYAKARTDFDAWIRVVIEAIKANTDLEKAAQDPHSAYSQALAAITKSAHDYIDKAKKLSDNPTVTAAVSLAGELFVAEISDTIHQAALAVYRDYLPALKEDQEKILAGLHALSLRKWEDIPAQQREPVEKPAPVVVVVVKPWSERADTAVRALITQSVAEQIVAITHPSGKHPALAGVTPKDLGGERVSVEITVTWKGSILGGSYQTKVEWIFNQTVHETAKVTADNAFRKVSTENTLKLHEYFMQTLFPPLKQSLK